MKSIFLALYLIIYLVELIRAQTDPLIVNWKKSTGTGYGSITADIDLIQYSTNYVYVHTSGIPSYSIGPWYRNPNNPVNKDFTFKFPRNPQNASTQTALVHSFFIHYN